MIVADGSLGSLLISQWLLIVRCHLRCVAVGSLLEYGLGTHGENVAAVVGGRSGAILRVGARQCGLAGLIRLRVIYKGLVGEVECGGRRR